MDNDQIEINSVDENNKYETTLLPTYKDRIDAIDAAHNQHESASIYTTIGSWGMLDGWKGYISRFFLPSKVPDPNTDDSPKTKEFFDKINQIPAGNECATIKNIYETVSGSVPGYGVDKVAPLQCYSTFEEALIAGAGICRDKAALLSRALQSKGIDARFVASTNHAWVRVKLKEGAGAGKEIDLDPTFYQSFIPLKNRDAQLDPITGCY